MPFENHAFHVMSCPQVANWICIPLLLKMWFVFEFKASNPDFISCVILNFHSCYNDTFDTNVGDAYFVSFPANPPSGAGWWQANIGRCNVLVHVGIKPFLEAELTHTHVARWRHLTTMASSHFRRMPNADALAQGLGILPLESEFFCSCSSGITVTSWMSAVAS